MKKEWLNPEVKNLGIEQTLCEEDLVGDAVTIDGEKTFYKCFYCNKRYWTTYGRDEHIKKCHKDQFVPGGMLPGESEDTIVPTFS